MRAAAPTSVQPPRRRGSMPSRRAARTAATTMTSTATSDRAMLDARRPGGDRDVGVVALVDAEERDAERKHECFGRARRSAEGVHGASYTDSFRWPRGTSGVGPSRLPRSTVERRPASSGRSLRLAFSGRISSVYSRSRSLRPASSSCSSTRRSRKRSSSTGFATRRRTTGGACGASSAPESPSSGAAEPPRRSSSSPSCRSPTRCSISPS